jgi:hypothetical protein
MGLYTYFLKIRDPYDAFRAMIVVAAAITIQQISKVRLFLRRISQTCLLLHAAMRQPLGGAYTPSSGAKTKK